MSLRAEFVMLAGQEGANVRALCRGYGISAQTGYKGTSKISPFSSVVDLESG